jgi:hypothetical protein
LQEGSGSTRHAGIVSANGKPLISAIAPTHNRAGSLPDAHAFDAAGGFDAGLTTGEDYDMWLRLAGTG